MSDEKGLVVVRMAINAKDNADLQKKADQAMRTVQTAGLVFGWVVISADHPQDKL